MQVVDFLYKSNKKCQKLLRKQFEKMNKQYITHHVIWGISYFTSCGLYTIFLSEDGGNREVGRNCYFPPSSVRKIVYNLREVKKEMSQIICISPEVKFSEPLVSNVLFLHLCKMTVIYRPSVILAFFTRKISYCQRPVDDGQNLVH